jgi:hypothetical protein
MIADSIDDPTDGVPRVVRPDDDTARLVVLTRPRIVALVLRLCAERAQRPPLPAALAAMPDDDLIALVRRLRN